jgi:DNA-binding HxlR family transcriptional regulator
MGETDNILDSASTGPNGNGNAGSAAGGNGANTPGAGKTPGRYAYEGLERVIHEKARLSILSSLASNEAGLLFNDLKALCTLTDGNLSRQLQVLQEAGFVEVWKGMKNNRPQTLCRLTVDGRRRFLDYISVLESVIANAGAAARNATNNPTPIPRGRVAPA